MAMSRLCNPFGVNAMRAGKGVQINSIQFYNVNGAGDTFDPSITLHPGCPYTPLWDFGDGTQATGISVSKNNYANAGPHLVTLYLPDAQIWLATIDVFNDKISGDFLAAISKCTALTSIKLYVNAAMSGNIASLAALHKLTYIQMSNTAIVGDIAVFAGMPGLAYLAASNIHLTGNIASLTGLPITYLALDDTDVVGNLSSLSAMALTSLWFNNGTLVDGDLSSLSAITGMSVLYLDNPANTGDLTDLAAMTQLTYLALSYTAVTGDITDLAAMTLLFTLWLNGTDVSQGTIGTLALIQHPNLSDCGWSQAAIDALLADMYAHRAAFTHATPTLNISGNAAPSGVYQNAAVPSTGKEYIFKLQNDPDAEGFKKWIITYVP